MKKTVFILLTVLFATVFIALLAACAKDVTVTKKTTGGSYTVSIKIEKGYLMQGKNMVELTVRNKQGNPIEGAKLTVTPSMPEMGHGTPWTSKITDKGKGRYKTNIPLTMGGKWEITIKVENDGTSDSAIFTFSEVRDKP